jgi:hypothetical protein
MKNRFAVLVLMMLPSLTFAHQDRILPIRADGTLGGLPSAYGLVRVHIERTAGNPRQIRSVVLTSKKFRISLKPCVIEKLKDVVHIEANGSWYHTRGTLPPYVSLSFYSSQYDPKSATNAYYSITYSLLDGHILMGQRAWHSPLGHWRAQTIDPADNCSHWSRLGV